MPDQPLYPVLRHAERVRRSMLYRDRRILAKLTRDYLAAYQSLKSQIKTLTAALAEMQPTQGQLMRVAALQSLLDGVRREMADLVAILANDLDEAIRIEIAQAGIDTYRAVQLALPGMEEARLMAMWTTLHPPQVYQMYGFLDQSGPLFAMLKNQFSDDVANLIRDALLSGYIQGMNPRTIAAIINKAFGTGLNWALRTARTSTLWAYRSASQISYANNTQVVKGWTWTSALDDRVCLSCLAQHGSFHPVTEILADHHNGRCVMSVQSRSWEELGMPNVPEVDYTQQDWYKKLTPEERAKFDAMSKPGEDWFRSMSAETQRQMMGPAKFNAWQDGAFAFKSLSQPYFDPIYGKMWREASLKSLLADKAERYYVANKLVVK